MFNWLGDFAHFLWAVVNNWAAYATGGLIVAIIWLWSYRDGNFPTMLHPPMATISLNDALEESMAAKLVSEQLFRYVMSKSSFDNNGSLTTYSQELADSTYSERTLKCSRPMGYSTV